MAVQIQLHNVSEEYARAAGLPSGTTAITVSACLQLTAFLASGIKSERVHGEQFA